MYILDYHFVLHVPIINFGRCQELSSSLMAVFLSFQLKALGQISQPNLNLTTVPKNALHTNILHQCGKGVLQYHIVQ